MVEKHWLYRIIFPNGKLYIGVSKTPFERFEGHCKAARLGEKNIVYHAIRKYGTENLKFELLVCGDKKYIYELEEAAIAKFRTQEAEFGYNDTKGGEGSWSRSAVVNSANKRRGKKVSEETRTLLSSQRKGRKQSPEWVARRTENRRKKDNFKHSEKAKEKIKLKRAEQIFSLESCGRMSKGQEFSWARRKAEFFPNIVYLSLYYSRYQPSNAANG